MNNSKKPVKRLRSLDWFDNPDHIDMTALYLERFMNYGVTPEELRSGKPIIGIAQSGSDLVPCNRVHVELVKLQQWVVAIGQLDIGKGDEGSKGHVVSNFYGV